MTDTNTPLAERMFAAGYPDLIPVIPPGAALAPSSKVAPSSIGKIPGKRLGNGLWVSGNWREWTATIDDVRTWQKWGANVGLRADRFPGVDIDCADEQLAGIIEAAAFAQLGVTPVRVGNWPKRLLMYRTDQPFGRMRLWMMKGDAHYLVEILGQGQQYLVSGTHPTTLRAYTWSSDPAVWPIDASVLNTITRDKADAFIKYMTQAAEMLGYVCKRAEGSGDVTRAGDQSGLQAPSVEDLRAAVALIPNSSAKFPGWDEYIKMLHAVRAAAGPDEEDGHDIFAEWAARWEDHGIRHADSNDPDAVRALWRRTRGPYSVGWPWLAELARPYGFNDAPFETETPTPVPGGDPGPADLSEQWMAVKVVESCNAILRFVPASEQWLVWNRGRWQPDAELLAEDTVKLELRKIADQIARRGGTEKEKRDAIMEARQICSSGKVAAVARLVKMDRAIAVSPELLDFDPWILNTPDGIIDLTTGRMRPADPDQLCTRSTAVTPDFDGAMPQWLRFLDEATAGNADLQQYLKRLAGYALTGSTQEQKYAFIHGDGGNGKGKFLEVLMGVFGSYHRNAPMDTFVASHNDRHPTELAALAGARLVTASESAAGKAWDEAKLKLMTGGDPITARHMREDFFTYVPQFTLIFIGNHKPEIRNLDPAMRRRTHLVPFTVKPKVIDQQLGAKLRQEWPAILAWMIEGCLEWQKVGLIPPAIVQAATEDYFDESDPVGQWLEERCEKSSVDEWIPLMDLFDSWREWANRHGDLYVGKPQRLSSLLATHGYAKRKHPRKRHLEFSGIKLNEEDNLKGLVAGCIGFGAGS